MRRLLTLLLAAPLALWQLTVTGTAQQAAPLPAGTVSRVQGPALAVRNATPRVLVVGDPIQIGDVLSTGADARLEIKMTDDSVFVLGEGAGFVVTDYTFGQAAAPTATFKVLQGAFLATSGKIAQLADNSMKVQTNTATIGIRGTTVWGGPIDGQTGVVLIDGRAVTVETAAGRVDLTAVGAGTGFVGEGAPAAASPWAAEKIARARATVTFR